MILSSVAAAAPAGDDDKIGAALVRWANQPILQPGQALAEMRSFLQARVTVWDDAASADPQTALETCRRRVLDEVVFRDAISRHWRQSPGRVEWLTASEPASGYRLQKLRYEVVPGLWVPALLYTPQPCPPRVAAVLNLSGHEPEGLALPAKQTRYLNLVQQGYAVLAVEWFGMGQLRTPGFNHYCMNQLDLCGASGFAVFYLALERALNLLVALPQVDTEKIAVTGLSGGGLQTIYLAALDPRVAAANPVAGYCGLQAALAYDDLGDSEHVPSDLATIADFTHLTAMVAPRPLLLTYNAADDCCFQAAHSLPGLLAAGRPAYARRGAAANLALEVNEDPGTHNFERANREALYRFLARSFSRGGGEDRVTERDAAAELQSIEALAVPLPERNLDLNQLALQVAHDVPIPSLPAGRSERPAWQAARRAELVRVLRYRPPCWQEVAREVLAVKPLRVTAHQLQIDGHFTLPLLACEPRRAHGTVVLVGDAGRAQLAERIRAGIASECRVVAVDPLLMGESIVRGSDPWYLFALHLAAVGERPLALQAAQLAAAVRWADEWPDADGPTVLWADGLRAAMAALAAAAVEVDLPVARLELWNSLASLRQLLEDNRRADEVPELLAWDLLRFGDVPLLAQLAIPRPIIFHAAGDRHRRELSLLVEAYRQAGMTASPWVDP